ncbi:hypothetical protein L915_08619 [Phytophthora nicotianae]|uniref:DDE-1 domain-containing protein n=1 Tax=Phytophthora nicotianae TaxID=4792 RepID=W2GWW5_PHYNI|nr:hypothetical protein L915_08619 [Phytophthora nicotianae]
MLLLDSLNVRYMASIRETLETECTTQVQYIPPGVTALSHPMDISVMPSKRRLTKAWDMVKAKSIVKSFRLAKLLPVGPRDVSNVFATYLHALPEAAVVDDASDIEDESFDK